SEHVTTSSALPEGWRAYYLPWPKHSFFARRLLGFLGSFTSADRSLDGRGFDSHGIRRGASRASLSSLFHVSGIHPSDRFYPSVYSPSLSMAHSRKAVSPCGTKGLTMRCSEPRSASCLGASVS